jgi:O-antigen/teichoic acid export membrane protein
MLTAARGRPTLVAQAINAAGALLLIALLTRQLSADAFGTYAAVFATYALGNALVATTIGTRIIEAASSGRAPQIELVGRRDVPAFLFCAAVAAVVAYSVDARVSVAAWAAVGMLGILMAEVGNSLLLGLQRYWWFCGAVLLRIALWVGGTAALLLLLEPDHRLAAALAMSGASALPLLAYLVVSRRVRIVGARSATPRGAVSAVGLANLALWILASADRVILSHYALAALATYAATYGLLDRVFRGLANADIQARLPAAFAGRPAGDGIPDRLSPPTLVALVSLGAFFAVASPHLIELISGGRYQPSFAMSVALSTAMVAMVAAMPSFVALIVLGRARVAAGVAGLAASINVVGNLLLVPHFDTTAATALTLGGYLVWLIGARIAVNRCKRPSAQLESPPGETRRQVDDELLKAQL